MKNDKTYFKRLDDNTIDFPEDVYPFDFHNIKMFASESNGQWGVTEIKTGCRIGDYSESQEEVVHNAKHTIVQHGINPTKQAIKDFVVKMKSGLKYDYDEKKWK